MDKPIETVSTEDFAAAVLANSQNEGTFEWHGLTIRYRNRLSLADMTVFVNTIANGCFDEESGTYAPETKHAALLLAVVSFYTNVDLGEDLSAQYEMLTASGLADKVIENIDRDQYFSLLEAVNEKIRYRAETAVSALQKKIEAAYAEIRQFADQLRDTFENVSGEDIGKLVGALAEGGFDEQKLVEAYLGSKTVQEDPEQTK